MAREPINGRERRAYIRLETALQVRFKVSGKEMSKIFTATTKNISHGGLCLEVQQDKEDLIDKLSADHPTLRIDLDSLIPDQDAAVSTKRVWVNSRVDWTRKSNSKNPALLLGLEFEDLTRAARKKIHDYLVEEFLKHYEELN
jgi:c-di-GMP-binding flagellar brake protein YcgR